MKRLRFLPLLIALLSSPVLTSALVAGGHAAEDEKPDTELASTMKELNGAFRDLRRALRDPDPAMTETYVGYVRSMRKAGKHAKTLSPARFAELPEAEVPERLEAYGKDMDGFLKRLDALEKALQAADWSAADAVVDSLRSHQSDSHKKYKKPEE